MSWRPNASLDVSRARAAMVDRMREYFREQGVLEVWTPILGETTVTAPSIESIPTALDGATRYLQTSPEYFMKRLLAAGYPDIYQCGPVFRHGEAGSMHLPEFTMVEWYRLGFDLSQIVDDATSLADRLIANRSLSSAEHIEYCDAFKQTLAIDPLSTDCEAIADALGAPDSLRVSLGENIDGWLDLAMAEAVAPAFPSDRLTVVRHYPATQAALARISPADQRLADRFEVFFGTIELANGYVELLDANELESRFKDDQSKRQRDGLRVHDIDDALLDALRSGMPGCAGVALGLDRLLMIDEGLDTIADVVTFTPADSHGH